MGQTSGVMRISGKRVLIADHDGDAAELYEIWLRGEGHHTSVAADAGEATRIAPIFQPDTAVIDVRSPLIAGLELVRALRAFSELDRCVFIAVAAEVDPLLRARCKTAGFSFVFEKPLLRSTLVDSLSIARRLGSRAG